MKVAHLIIDAKTRSDKAGSKEFAEKFLKELASLLEMNVLAGPVSVEGGTFPGVTAFMIIEESHVSVHTFTDKGKVCLDVFSCKPFNPDMVLTLTDSYYDLQDVKTYVVHRDF